MIIYTAININININVNVNENKIGLMNMKHHYEHETSTGEPVMHLSPADVPRNFSLHGLLDAH